MGFDGGGLYLLGAMGHLSDLAWSELTAGKAMTLQQAGIANYVHKWFQQEAFMTAQSSGQITDWERYPLASLPLPDVGRTLISMDPRRAKLFRTWLHSVEPSRGGEPLENLTKRFILFLKDDVDRSGAEWVLKLTRAEFEKRHADFKFRLCEQDQWKIRLSLPNEQYRDFTIKGDFFPTSPVIDFANLPEGIRKAMWDYASAFNLDTKNGPKIIINGKAVGGGG